MKVNFFIGSISGGGAERMVCNLANYLDSRDFKVRIITMAEAEDTYGLRQTVEVTPLLYDNERRGSIYNGIIRFIRLGRLMKAETCDCYIVLLPITIIMMLLQWRLSKAPIIASERNDPDRYNMMVKMLLKRLARRAESWVFQTENAKEWYKNYIRQGEVIPNAINQLFIQPRYEGVRDNRIVAVGRLDDQKNYDLLIDAFYEVSKKHPEYSLHIFGKGPKEKELKEKVDSLGLAQKIHFMGYVKNIKESIYNAKLYVMTSNYEGMPNSLIEAMALGLPCVSTDCPVGGPRFLIENEKNGILVEVEDRNALIIAINNLLENEDYSERLSREAIKIQDRLSPDIIYNQWMRLINEIAIKNK